MRARLTGRIYRLGALLAVLLPVLTVPEESAANFAKALDNPCNGSFAARCFAENRHHEWDHDLGPRNKDAVLSTISGSYETTDMNFSWVNYGGHTLDLWYQSSNLPAGIFGSTSCERGNGTHRCTHWHIDFDNSNGDIFNDSELWSLACHETGHSVGLMHPEIESHGLSIADDVFGCMRTALNMNPWDKWLREHNANHIDNFYYPD